MSDRVFFSLAALAAIVMIALAAVWPQGLGARSPGVFGHPVAPTREDIAREAARRIAADPKAAAAIAGLRSGK